MLEILQFYVSSFWVWLGLTVGLTIVVRGLSILLTMLIAGIRGGHLTINGFRGE